MNKPQVGDDALFFPADRDAAASGLAAKVAHVWSDTCVNLQVLNADGAPASFPTAVLVYDPASAAAKPGGYFCVIERTPPQTIVQPKIAGYRQLSAEDAALINVVKGAGEEIEALLGVVKERLASGAVGRSTTAQEAADAQRWLAMARTDLQVGLMKLVRAIAQPVSF